VNLHSTQSGDTRREEKRLENRWHKLQKRSKGKVPQMAALTGGKLDYEFDDPIGILKNVHRQIKRLLHVLWVIADRAAGRELTGEEKAAVRSAMDCLRVDETRHTADEEESLFPRLCAMTMTGDSEELIALEDNRRHTDGLHAIVDTLYLTWISAGELRPEDQLLLQSCTEQLKSLSEQHIQIEEQIVFPRAERIFDRRTIAAIGQEFRARRS